VIDGVATYYGIKASLIFEANPLMTHWNPLSILLVKIFLSTFLVAIVLGYPVFTVNKFIKNLIVFANVCYLGVFGLHIYWIAFI
jgi:hypothetical protein